MLPSDVINLASKMRQAFAWALSALRHAALMYSTDIPILKADKIHSVITLFKYIIVT